MCGTREQIVETRACLSHLSPFHMHWPSRQKRLIYPHMYTPPAHTHTHIITTRFVSQTLLKSNLGMLSSDMIHK